VTIDDVGRGLRGSASSRSRRADDSGEPHVGEAISDW
jgi:hypothetical protein